MSRAINPSTRRVLTLATLFGVSVRRLVRRRRPRPGRRSSPPTGRRSACSPLFVVFTLFITKWAAAKHQVGGRLLHRRRWHHRLPERPGDRRRLHVGGLVPGHLGGGHGQRLRRPDLFDRLPRRLAGDHLPDGRAAAQPGQVHFRRRGRLSLQARAGAHLRGLGHAGGGGLLPDRADGRRRPADQAAVRAGILDRGGHRRRADDGLRAVRRHDRHHLGADHQGLPAAGRRHLHGAVGDVALRLQPRGDVCRAVQDQDRPGTEGRQDGRGGGHSSASRSWARATSSRTRSRPSASAWR